MAADPVTPVPGAANTVVTGGTAVIAVAANADGIGGCYIQNPYDPADQGLGSAEPIYVSPVAEPGLEGNDFTFRIEPGGTWTGIAGQVTPTWVNATTSGHKFTVVSW